METIVHDLIGLASLTLLEIALCIDNAIFITILSSKLQHPIHRHQARIWGIVAAMIINLVMISIIHWYDQLQIEVFAILGKQFSVKDLIMLAGGAFLIANTTMEIHHKMEGDREGNKFGKSRKSTLNGILIKMLTMNIVFSFDSVLTAIAVVHEFWKMVFAIVVALVVMYFFIKPIDYFVKQHPSSKILAMSFLLLIGMVLIMNGLGEEIDKGYVYFAMIFSIFVEVLNISTSKSTKKAVELREIHLSSKSD